MIGETNPEVINGLINAGAWLDMHIAAYGPGVAFAATVAIAWQALKRANHLVDELLRQAARRGQIRDEQQQMADLSTAIDQAPLIPTQHGHDRQALDACQAMWNADSRKETP